MISMPSVILVRPESSWNIGSVARVASNLSVPQLLLVNPQHLDTDDIQRTACDAPLSKTYTVVDGLQQAVSEQHRVVGFTARRSRHRSSHISYHDFLNQLKVAGPSSMAFCFGPERTGLSNEDLSHCSDLVYIPTAETCPSMNLAQAVTAALFGMSLQALSVENTTTELPNEPLATGKDWQPCFEAIDTIIATCAADKTPPHVPGIIRRMLKRSRASTYELSLLRSLFGSAARELGFRSKDDSHQ